ncbi:MAG: NUDIX hydrolase [Actinomycetota bacterium]
MNVPLPLPRPPRRFSDIRETSAGGLIMDDRAAPRVAVISRRNRAGRVEWCLPKGHVEGTETLPETAMREVAEETGIVGRIVCDLGAIDYWFSVPHRRIHKVVHHYLMERIGGRLTIANDPDAEAIDAAWVPLEKLGSILTFPNERRIANLASRWLANPQ